MESKSCFFVVAQVIFYGESAMGFITIMAHLKIFTSQFPFASKSFESFFRGSSIP